jgi:hypothetical protein
MNEYTFQEAFGITIRHNIRFNVGFGTVIGVKVVIDFDVIVGIYVLYQHHDN